MTRIATQFVLVTLIALTAAAPALRADDATPTTQPSATQVVKDFSDKVLAILRDKSLSDPQKRAQVKTIVYTAINFPIMGRLCVGRNWHDMSDDQKTDYVEQFKELVINTYIHLVDDYTDQSVKYLGDRQESNGDWTVLTQIVGTKDNKPNQEVAKVDYRLRNRDGAWKVIDLIIENASLVANYRAQFQEIISNGGIDHLLQTLHDKNAANDN
jgi:phospholipid transport system substrate-binding protein